MKFSDWKAKKLSETLSPDELIIVHEYEQRIDKQLEERFNGCGLTLDSELIDVKSKNIKDVRWEILTNYILKLYEDAGWNIQYQEFEDDTYGYCFSEKK